VIGWSSIVGMILMLLLYDVVLLVLMDFFWVICWIILIVVLVSLLVFLNIEEYCLFVRMDLIDLILVFCLVMIGSFLLLLL